MNDGRYKGFLEIAKKIESEIYAAKLHPYPQERLIDYLKAVRDRKRIQHLMVQEQEKIKQEETARQGRELKRHESRTIRRNIESAITSALQELGKESPDFDMLKVKVYGTCDRLKDFDNKLVKEDRNICWDKMKGLIIEYKDKRKLDQEYKAQEQEENYNYYYPKALNILKDVQSGYFYDALETDIPVMREELKASSLPKTKKLQITELLDGAWGLAIKAAEKDRQDRHENYISRLESEIRKRQELIEYAENTLNKFQCQGNFSTITKKIIGDKKDFIERLKNQIEDIEKKIKRAKGDSSKQPSLKN